jgi:hypothetical protein
MKHARFRQIFLVFVFSGFIILPMLNDIFHFVDDAANLENRKLKERPDLNVNLLDPFPAQYDSFYTDHFSFRSLAIKWYGQFVMRVYKKTPFPTFVAIGHNNWLFNTGTEMNRYEPDLNFPPEYFETIKKNLEYMNRFLEKQNCKFYFCIAPCKAVIYEENVMPTHYKFREKCWGELVNEYVRKNTGINTIDLYGPMLKIKDEHQLYYKHDSHWNRWGGFYAANTIFSVIEKDLPSIKQLSPEDYIVDEIPRKEGDALRVLGNPDVPADVEHIFKYKKDGKPVKFDPLYYPEAKLYFRDTKDSSKPNMILCADSYANSIFPFLSENFSRSVHFFDLWQYNLDTNLVKKEKPRVFILLIHEPLLGNLTRKQF